MKKQTKSIAFILPLAAIVVGGAGCATQTQPPQQTPEQSQTSAPVAPTPSSTPTPVTASNPESAKPTVKSFSMKAKRWAFDPDVITVNKGDVVRLSIKSVDVTHGFALPDFNVSQNLNPGETSVVEFTADKTGTFTFFCSVFCGAGHPHMKGKLIVK